ncbi:phosphotransferase family protein [Nocardia nova]|uniref:Phosphotransferase family protein n=1 Tax=Nocardia nova TaxID=37330 RepID=A0A2S6A243_9NOCA|nr:phosphotransferase family protein [Nocardia nova]PPJ25579.1 phosphotransferase family protein [Nocardia nova]
MTSPAIPTVDLGAGVTALLKREPERDDISVTEPVKIFGGNARHAWTCTATWRVRGRRFTEEMILLVRPAGSQVDTDPGWEFVVLDGLAAQGVRAPRIWAHDPSGELFGGPAVLLQRLPGRADAVEYLEADLATGRARTLDLARALAELHAATPPDLGVEVSPVTRWRAQFEEARLEPWPTVSWLFDWLQRHYVPSGQSVLVHGDFRPGNVLYSGDRITGILDWEMTHLGDPVEDIAWAYRALWSPGRFVPLDEFVAAYEAAGGPPVTAEALQWNRVFCEVKFAVISLRAARSFADGTSHNLRLVDRARTVVPAMQRCLRWISEPNGNGARC